MALGSTPRQVPAGHHCPACGGKLERLHRNALDRWVSLFRSVHRYRCAEPDCAWEGVLGRLGKAEGSAHAPTWRVRVLWFAMGAAFALAAVQGTRLALRQQPGKPGPVRGGTELQSLATPPGHDFEGELLPATDARVARNPSPLTLRRSCSWGRPGGNPYRGTVAQALSASQLPADVVRQIDEMVERGWVRSQVEISRTGIRTLDGRRHFSSQIAAMGFGNTLCFKTRVNFVEGHVEYASLYEATDSQGKSYAVMVPYVCRNVSVLGERAEAEDETPKLPEPASWTLGLLALGLLAVLRRRRPRSEGR
ncbi:MAG: MYXO-CTERM sorting domain-containing protein [Rubrivivax sp.]|nr:MYXO-CTERM sorting domain-containing protein [Rubrivivax sp.]